MTENRDRYMLCCDCGYAVKEKTMFKKAYKHIAICLCEKCARELQLELTHFLMDKGIEKLKEVNKNEN